MTLQLLHSEIPYIYEENLIFFFISVENKNLRLTVCLLEDDVSCIQCKGMISVFTRRFTVCI